MRWIARQVCVAIVKAAVGSPLSPLFSACQGHVAHEAQLVPLRQPGGRCKISDTSQFVSSTHVHSYSWIGSARRRVPSPILASHSRTCVAQLSSSNQRRRWVSTFTLDVPIS